MQLLEAGDIAKNSNGEARLIVRVLGMPGTPLVAVGIQAHDHSLLNAMRIDECSYEYVGRCTGFKGLGWSGERYSRICPECAKK